MKFEGATTVYIRRLCGVFFPSLSETGKEFVKAFQEHFGCMSAFVVWAQQELLAFVKTFHRQVFGGKSTLSVIVECVQIARQNCNELCVIGLDLSHAFDSMIVTDLERIILEHKDQCIEGIKYRAADDQWRPMNHLNDKDCKKFIEEMSLAGLDLQSFVYDNCFISLTMNTVQFSKACLCFTKDLLTVHTQEMNTLITDSIAQLFTAHVNFIKNSLLSPSLTEQHKFILKNAQYILETVMGIIESYYKEKKIVFPKELQKINGEYRKMKSKATSSS